MLNPSSIALPEVSRRSSPRFSKSRPNKLLCRREQLIQVTLVHTVITFIIVYLAVRSARQGTNFGYSDPEGQKQLEQVVIY